MFEELNVGKYIFFATCNKFWFKKSKEETIPKRICSQTFTTSLWCFNQILINNIRICTPNFLCCVLLFLVLKYITKDFQFDPNNTAFCGWNM
jgi:hypothetical protein